MTTLVLTYVVALTVTSLHAGGELRYELQQWKSGNISVDTDNCEGVRKKLIGPAARLGRIVLCDTYQQAVPVYELPKRVRTLSETKTKSKIQEQGDAPVPNPEPRPKDKKKKKERREQKK